MSYTPLAVVAQYFPFDDFMFTYNVAAGVVIGDVGKAVALDTTASNQVKLTGAGDAIFGRLYTFEDRTQQGGALVGTVERKLRCKLTYTGTAPSIGDQVEGSATPGVVQTTATQPADNLKANRVIEVDTVGLTVTVEKL